MPRLQSEVGTGRAAKKGSVLNKSNDEPMANPLSGMLEGHREFGPGQEARISRPSANQHQNVAGTGSPVNDALTTPLAGHQYGPLSARGNSPKRGAGSKTPTEQNPAKPSLTA